MKIFITGSNGLLGQKLISLLVPKQDIQLIATSRGENRVPPGNYVYDSLDITNEDEVLAKVEKHRPDVIINTAAMTNVDQCEDEKELCRLLNVEAVNYLVKACEKTGCFLLHLSTDFIFDGAAGPYNEEASPNPVSFYGQSKLDAENIITKSSIDWAIARTVLVYGITPHMSRSNIILWVKKSLEEGKDIQVVNDQWRTPTLAEDLAEGCFLIAQKKAKGIFNISGKDFLNPYQMAEKTADYFHLDKKHMHETDGSKFTQKAKRPPKTGFIIDKAQKVLGYEPRSFDEGIAIVASQL